MGQSFDPFLLDSILTEIEIFSEIFCRTTKNKKLLLWPVLRSIVEDFRGSSVRFFEAREACVAYPSNDRLR